MRGVDGPYTSPFYIYTKCQASHLVGPNYGLNFCVSTSQLHNFCYLRKECVVVPPDSTHLDCLTKPGVTIRELSYTLIKREQK